MALIPLPQVVSAPGVNAPLNAQALTAPARAIGQFSKVADVAGDYAMKVQDARDAADLVRARNVMKAEEAAFASWAETEQDTEKWQDGAEERISVARDVVQSLGASGRVMRQIDVELEGWSGETRIKAQQAKLRRDAENADRELVAGMEQAADQGNQVAVEEALRQRQALGLMHESEVPQVRRKMQQRADVMQVNRLINISPIAAVEAIDEKDANGDWKNWRFLDDNQRMQLKREARYGVSQVHVETVRDFQDRLNGGEAITQEELQAAVDAQKITPQQMKNLLSYQRGTAGYADNVMRMADLSARISAWSPGMEDAKVELNRIAADLGGLPRAMQEPLETALRRRSTGDIEVSRTAEAEDYIDWLRAESFLGNTRRQKKGDDAPGDYVDREEAAKAAKKAIDLKTALAAFVRDNPKATPADQREFIAKTLKGERATHGARATLNVLTGVSE